MRLNVAYLAGRPSASAGCMDSRSCVEAYQLVSPDCWSIEITTEEEQLLRRAAPSLGVAGWDVFLVG